MELFEFFNKTGFLKIIADYSFPKITIKSQLNLQKTYLILSICYHQVICSVHNICIMDFKTLGNQIELPKSYVPITS